MNLGTYLADVRQKPDHVRKQVAITLALICTALIAILWLSLNLATGTFALKGSSFADAAKNGAKVQAESAKNTSLLGAVGAAFTGDTGPAHVEVVEPGRELPKPKTETPEPTVLPF